MKKKILFLSLIGTMLLASCTSKEKEDVKETTTSEVSSTTSQDTNTSTSTSTSTSTPEYKVNRAKFMAAFATSEIEDVSATVVIDFLYGKAVDTLSDSAKKDYKDATNIINKFFSNEKR